MSKETKPGAGKLRPSLVHTSLIRAVAAVRDYGERKHGGSADPWDNHPAEEHRDSLYRHWLEYLDDPECLDEESGLPVLWHIACKIDFLIELAERKRHGAEGKPTLRRAIAIDFDGCLCTDAAPEIGDPNWDVINRAKAEQRAGAGLILWTCRTGQMLQDALDACKSWELTFDAVDDSLPDWIEAYGDNPRKIGASEYWDDKAVRMGDNPPLTLEELLEMGKDWVWIKLLTPHYGIDTGYYIKYEEDPSVDAFQCGYPSTWVRGLSYSLYGDTWLAYRRKPEGF